MTETNIQNLSNPFFFLLFKGCFSAFALLALFFLLGFYLEIEISRTCGERGQECEGVCFGEGGVKWIKSERPSLKTGMLVSFCLVPPASGIVSANKKLSVAASLFLKTIVCHLLWALITVLPGHRPQEWGMHPCVHTCICNVTNSSAFSRVK